MKLWIDDERRAPDDSWTVAKSSAEAIKILEAKQVHDKMLRQETILDIVALDHDLGYVASTSFGLPPNDYIWPAIEYIYEQHIFPRIITIHTANPYGRQQLVQFLTRHFPQSEVLSLSYPLDYEGLIA